MRARVFFLNIQGFWSQRHSEKRIFGPEKGWGRKDILLLTQRGKAASFHPSKYSDKQGISPTEFSKLPQGHQILKFTHQINQCLKNQLCHLGSGFLSIQSVVTVTSAYWFPGFAKEFIGGNVFQHLWREPGFILCFRKAKQLLRGCSCSSVVKYMLSMY